jgi:hypothetical protein
VSAGNFLASLPGNLNLPSGPLQEIMNIGKINIKTAFLSDIEIFM